MENDLFLIYLLTLIVLFSLAYLGLRLRREARVTAARRHARFDVSAAGTARRR